jgi:hypothetical protein
MLPEHISHPDDLQSLASLEIIQEIQAHPGWCVH